MGKQTPKTKARAKVAANKAVEAIRSLKPALETSDLQPKPLAKNQTKGLKKKIKRKEKKEKLLTNITKAIAAKRGKSTPEKPKPQKSVLVLNNLSELQDALPVISETDTLLAKTKAPKITSERRNKIFSAELKQFSDVLHHPAYKTNPLGAITEHIKNMVTIMQQQQSEAKEKEKIARKKDRQKQKKKDGMEI